MKARGATRALALGLLSLPFAVFAPFAIVSGARSLRRVPSVSATAGLIAGIVSLATLVGVAVYWLVAT